MGKVEWNCGKVVKVFRDGTRLESKSGLFPLLCQPGEETMVWGTFPINFSDSAGAAEIMQWRKHTRKRK